MTAPNDLPDEMAAVIDFMASTARGAAAYIGLMVAEAAALARATAALESARFAAVAQMVKHARRASLARFDASDLAGRLAAMAARHQTEAARLRARYPRSSNR